METSKEIKSRNWSFEDKLRIVQRYFNEELGIKRLAKEENILLK